MSYTVFFTFLLIGLGLLFRQILVTILNDRVEEVLREDWGAIKGYLRFENQRPFFFADPADPEEAFIVARLQHVYLLTDSARNVLAASETYQTLGIDSKEEIAQGLAAKDQIVRVKTTPQGGAYLIRSGYTTDDHNRKYYLSIGRSLIDTRSTVLRFTWNYFTVLPFVILGSSLFGWFLAGRAIEPVNSVARSAQRITSSNLHTQIPLRNAGDELDNLIETFNRMIERLNLSFEQIRQFSTDVSHELRTPITAIRGQLEVALFTAVSAEDFRNATVNAMQDVERLSSIVRALLLLSQAESGQLALQTQPLDLAASVEDIVDQFQIPAEEVRIALSAKISGECMIRADRVQIERLLANLVSNALKYTPEGGQVRVLVEASENRAALIVEDNGLGIPADQLPHIFDRFYRVRSRETNTKQGLGLGLSFVAWIVKAHHGTIEVDSNVGKGTRFIVTLPLLVSDPEPVVAVASSS